MLLRHSRVALLHFFISITHSLSSSSLQLQTLNQPQLSNQTCLIEASSSLASAFPSKCLNTFSILGQDCQALLNDKGNAIVRCLGESDLNKLLDSALESNAAPLNKAIPSRWLVLVKNHMEKCLALKDLDIILESVLLWVFVETHVLEDAVAFLEQSEDSRLISAPQHNKLEQKTAGKCWKALVSPSMKSNILGWEEGDCFGPLDPATEKPINSKQSISNDPVRVLAAAALPSLTIKNAVPNAPATKAVPVKSPIKAVGVRTRTRPNGPSRTNLRSTTAATVPSGAGFASANDTPKESKSEGSPSSELEDSNRTTYIVGCILITIVAAIVVVGISLVLVIVLHLEKPKDTSLYTQYQK